jgi:DNA-binding MarR family transcriptional regulator
MSSPRRRSTASRRAAGAPLLGALFRLGWQRVRQHLAADVRTGEFADLQDAHLSVFQYPGPDGLRPSDLARQLRMSRQATNYLIAQLEALGYLERRSGPQDASRRVYATARGHRLLKTIEASVHRFEAQCERQVGRRRFNVFLTVLRTISGEQGAAASGESRRPTPGRRIAKRSAPRSRTR